MAKKPSAKRSDQAVRQQYGALPYRVGADGALELMLITSRSTRRWIIPKGWPMKDLKPAEAAAREAYEEAGVRGSIARRAIGRFRYDKLLDADGLTVPCEVKVFALRVERQAKAWPEQDERETRWLSPGQAVSLISEEGLRELITAFAGHAH